MPQDLRALGQNERMRKRRYKVLRLWLKGATAGEIAHNTGEKIKTIYNDLDYIRATPLNTLPVEVIRDMGVNFYELKVRELEARIAKVPPEEARKHPNYVLGLEKLVQRYKEESLKMQGCYQENINHTGGLNITFEEIDASPTTEAREDHQCPGDS